MVRVAGRAGVAWSHGHTSTPPSTSRSSFVSLRRSPLLAQALSSCGGWAWCPKARGVSADQGWRPVSARAGGLLSTGPPGSPPTWKHWVSSHYGSREVLEGVQFSPSRSAVMASTNTTQRGPGAGAQHSGAEEREASRLCEQAAAGAWADTATEAGLCCKGEKGVLACRELNF